MSTREHLAWRLAVLSAWAVPPDARDAYFKAMERAWLCAFRPPSAPKPAPKYGGKR